MKPSLYIYIHIPFCLQKCKYCDFATTTWKNNDFARQYTQWIIKELQSRGTNLKNHLIQSVYFGGGTPSLLPAVYFKQMLTSIKNEFSLNPKAEVTVEVNPGTLSQKKIEDYVYAGINRFSIGVQTFSDSLLSLCGRKHTALETKETLKLAEKNQLNFSCDLLFALPHQKLKSVQNDLTEMLSYSPKHISTYCLTLPDQHFMQNHRPSDEKQIQMFEWIENTLLKHSYFQYEISNFSKKGFKSQHNLAYWTDQEFWGLGISSHSYLKQGPHGVRFWNPKNMQLYTSQLSNKTSVQPYSHLPKTQVEFLTYKTALSDDCHTSLRTSKGIQKKHFQHKFGNDILSQIHNRLAPFEKHGLVVQNLSSWKLSFKGRMLSNQIFSSLLF